MTRGKRMVMVDAWLRGSQTVMDYADSLKVDVSTFLGWIVDYGQPVYSSGWIPVRILDGSIDQCLLDAAYCGEDLRPDRLPSHERRPAWIPVVIQERA
jgi:hypothetical protein